MIVCADDFGLTEDINQAILELVHLGRISAVSCLVGASKCTDEWALKLRSFASRIDLGLHFALTEVSPLSPVASISSVCNGDRFCSFPALLRLSLMRRVGPKDVHREIGMQYDLFLRRFGRKPDFIDGHMHVHQLPGVREGLVAFWEDLPVEAKPYVRNAYVPLVKNLLQRVSVLKNLYISIAGKGMRRMLKKHDIPTNSGFGGIYSPGHPERYSRYLRRFTDNMESPRGILMTHPGFSEKWRRMEYEALRESEWPEGLCRRFGLETGQ